MRFKIVTLLLVLLAASLGYSQTNMSGGGTNIYPNYLDINEMAAPANPVAGKQRTYADSTSHLLTCLTSSGGSCNPGAGGISSWPQLGGGTNTTSAFILGTGSSLTVSGTGTNTATHANSMTLGSILFAGSGGVFSQDNSKFFWDNTNKQARSGPSSASFSARLVSDSNFVGSILGTSLNVSGSPPGVAAVGESSLSNTYPLGLNAVGSYSGNVANTGGPTGMLAAAYVTGTGSVANSIGHQVNMINASTALISIAQGLYISPLDNSNGGTVTNNYGIFVDNQISGTNNWAIKTGTGKVDFGDVVSAAGGSANKVVCWKADGKTLGYATVAEITAGTCH